MRKKLSLRLLVGVAVLSVMGCLNAGYSDLPTLRRATFDEQEFEKGSVQTTRRDVDVKLSGMVRQDWIGLDKIYTLHSCNDDQHSGFRSKSYVDIAATYGNKTYGKSAADARIRLTNYGYWYDESYYTPFSNDTRAVNMLTYMEEMWINLHFGTFFNAYDNWFSFKNHPVSLKMGYFPYTLGRGIALGDFPINIPYLGWNAEKYDDARFNQPGILIHGNINKDITYDLYYSKQSEKSNRYGSTWEKVNANRTDGRRPWRGVSKDRDLWTARMDFTQQKRWGDLHVQPYMMYVDAPELSVEVKGDSSARLGTVGLMTEFKRGRFSLNAEVAGQFGHQNMHAIDRNRTFIDADEFSGLSVKKYTHVFTGNKTNEAPGWANGNYNSDLYYINNTKNRGGREATTHQWLPAVTKNGDQLYTAEGGTAMQSYSLGSALTPAAPINTYNSDVTGNARFRDSYRVDYRGFMGVLDMKYEFEEVPVAIAAAGAYISGDKYPYNTEKDKRYRAFIPYGDYYYVGKYVYSQVLLEERKLPRPVNISLHHRYAFNNDQDMSNLAYLGTGVDWRPFKDKNRLSLKSNVLWFWETTTLKKWDQHGKLPTREGAGDALFNGNRSWFTSNGVWQEPVDDRSIATASRYDKGWETKEDASRYLGLELNFEAQYRPIKNCIILAQLGCFMPGQLYKDVEHMPNINMVGDSQKTTYYSSSSSFPAFDAPQAAKGNFGLGHDPVWRAALAVDYRF